MGLGFSFSESSRDFGSDPRVGEYLSRGYGERLAWIEGCRSNPNWGPILGSDP